MSSRRRYGGETGTVEVSVPLFSLVDAMLRGRWSEYQEQRDRFREDPELATGFESQLLCIDAMEAWLKGRLGDLVEVIEALPPTLMLVRPGLAIALAEARRPDDARCVIAECATNGGLEARSRTVFGRAELAMLALAAAGIGDVEAAARLYELLAPGVGRWRHGARGRSGVLSTACSALSPWSAAGRTRRWNISRTRSGFTTPRGGERCRPGPRPTSPPHCSPERAPATTRPPYGSRRTPVRPRASSSSPA